MVSGPGSIIWQIGAKFEGDGGYVVETVTVACSPSNVDYFKCELCYIKYTHSINRATRTPGDVGNLVLQVPTELQVFELAENPEVTSLVSSSRN